MTTAKELLGRTMRAARLARGLRQEDVAEALAVDKKQVGRWERGENAPGGLRLTSFVAFLREKSDAADLEALEASIDAGIAKATADEPLAFDLAQRSRADQVFARLSRRPSALERWLTLGEGIAEGLDDIF